MKPRDTQSFAVRLYNNKDSKNEDGRNENDKNRNGKIQETRQLRRL